MHFTEPATQRARIAHQCSLCFRRIDPGETYMRVRGFDGGDAWTFRGCAHCEELRKLYDLTDHDGLVGEEGAEYWLDNGPRDVREARHMAQFKMRWRTKAGTLLPVPVADVEVGGHDCPCATGYGLACAGCDVAADVEIRRQP